MFPGMTYSPPNFFTPKYFGFESLPFLEVPPAFLVAPRTCWNDANEGVPALLGAGGDEQGLVREEAVVTVAVVACCLSLVVRWSVCDFVVPCGETESERNPVRSGGGGVPVRDEQNLEYF